MSIIERYTPLRQALERALAEALTLEKEGLHGAASFVHDLRYMIADVHDTARTAWELSSEFGPPEAGQKKDSGSGSVT